MNLKSIALWVSALIISAVAIAFLVLKAVPK